MSVPEDRVLAIYMGVSFGAFQGSPVRATIVWWRVCPLIRVLRYCLALHFSWLLALSPKDAVVTLQVSRWVADEMK